jgi:hypothetical protein
VGPLEIDAYEMVSYNARTMVLDTVGNNIDAGTPWPPNALLTVDTSAKKLNPTPAYYAFRHFSQFIEVGAKRIDHGNAEMNSLDTGNGHVEDAVQANTVAAGYGR